MRCRLAAERHRREWTQKFVADKLGISLRAYQYYECGERAPSLYRANQLEDLFGVPQRELLVRHCTPDSTETEPKVLQNSTA